MLPVPVQSFGPSQVLLKLVFLFFPWKSPSVSFPAVDRRLHFPLCRPGFCGQHPAAGAPRGQGRRQQHGHPDWLPGRHHPAAVSRHRRHPVATVLEEAAGQGETRPRGRATPAAVGN